MISQLGERIRLADGSLHWLSGEERENGSLYVEGAACLREFRLEMGLPVWKFEIGGHVIEKRLLLPHFQNTVVVSYTLFGGAGPLRLRLRPLLAMRVLQAPVDHPIPDRAELATAGETIEVRSTRDIPALRLRLADVEGQFTAEPVTIRHLFYRREHSRGYETSGSAWSPGYFWIEFAEGQTVTLIASTEPTGAVTALSPGAARSVERDRRRALLLGADPTLADKTSAELVLAADQFVITPPEREEDVAAAAGPPGDRRTVIAGYHWFTDWGRDTMISLEGLTLVTGRLTEARSILRTFAAYVREGLIPNLFPEGDTGGLYNTADATLWFFHAVQRYLDISGDRETVEWLLPVLNRSIDRHVAGTRFNIGVDPADGLIRQGVEGLALTWMDAKLADWIVTPRRGKAVEINALWYNALRLCAHWNEHSGRHERAAALNERAARVRTSFNSRFWFSEGGYLYDVVDGEHGDDAACRPNQILAFALRHPVLDKSPWEDVLDVVESRLLTAFGLRSLDPSHPDYKPDYHGDLQTRDAAYHQGTVWPWLIGPFIDAWIRVHPDNAPGARRFLKGFIPHLGEACVGSISEIFDAERPYRPEGCIAQAWSVAEVLRCWAKTASRGDIERGSHSSRRALPS